MRKQPTKADLEKKNKRLLGQNQKLKETEEELRTTLADLTAKNINLARSNGSLTTKIDRYKTERLSLFNEREELTKTDKIQKGEITKLEKEVENKGNQLKEKIEREKILIEIVSNIACHLGSP